MSEVLMSLKFKVMVREVRSLKVLRGIMFQSNNQVNKGQDEGFPTESEFEMDLKGKVMTDRFQLRCFPVIPLKQHHHCYS